MRYELGRLGPKEFENLSQTLFVGECGLGAKVYGTGRDGGREATYTGEVELEGAKGSWDGYCILQAKFKEVIEESRKNIDWLKGQISKEIADWKERPTKKPDYLVFSVNIPLTPVSEVGGMDEIDAHINDLQKKHGIPKKGWAVWHQEMIYRLLDKNTDIRTSYGAWVLPGDVLAKVFEEPRKKAKEVSKALRLHVSKELVQQRFVNLDQAGSASDNKISLSQVFFDPPFHKHGLTGGTTLDFLIDKANQWSLRKAPETDPKNGNFVLIGGPGQGKSTVTQFMCQYYRASFLKEISEKISAIDFNAKTVMRELEKTRSENDIPKIATPRFPVNVPLTRLADSLAREEVNSVLGYLSREIAIRSEITVEVGDLRDFMSSVPWLLVLDGLDEVPVSSNRKQVIEAINDFLLEVTEASGDVFIVATTRPQGYTEEFSPDFYEHIDLAPLDEVQAISYGEKLALVRHGDENDRAERLTERLRRAAEVSTTSRLMTSPLQVTIMAVLLDRVGQAPKDRYSLFADYYRVIYERELEKEGHSSHLLRNHQNDIKAIHSDIGVLLQTKGESSGDTYSSLTLSEVRKLVENRLQSEGHEGIELENLASQMITASTDRLVFIVQLRQNEFGFEIRSLQEFLAACGIVDGSDEEISLRLNKIAYSSYWRNVLLFSLGYIFAERRSLRDVATSILSVADVHEGHDGSRSLLKLGSSLAAETILDGMERAPKYHGIFLHKAVDTLQLPPCEINKDISRIFGDKDRNLQEELVRDYLIGRGGTNTMALLTFLHGRVSDGDQNAKEQLDLVRSKMSSDERKSAVKSAARLGELGVIEAFCGDLISAPISFLCEVSEDLTIGRARNFLIHHSRGYRDAQGVFSKFIFGGAINFEKRIVRIRILDTESLLQAIPVKRNSDLDGMDHSMFPEDHWFPQVMRFIESPTAASLGDFIEYSKRLQIFAQEDVVRFFVHRVPWPLAYAILNHDSIDVNEIREGKYGDLDDWLALEERWAKESFDSSTSFSFEDWVSQRSAFLPIAISENIISVEFGSAKERAKAVKEFFLHVHDISSSIHDRNERSNLCALALCHFVDTFPYAHLGREKRDRKIDYLPFMVENRKKFIELTRTCLQFASSPVYLPWMGLYPDVGEIADFIENEVLTNDFASVSPSLSWIDFWIENPSYFRMGLNVAFLYSRVVFSDHQKDRIRAIWLGGYKGAVISPEKAACALIYIYARDFEYDVEEMGECIRFLIRRGFVSIDALSSSLPLNGVGRNRMLYVSLVDLFCNSDLAFSVFHDRLSAEILATPTGVSFPELRSF